MSGRATLLVELFTEELPPKALRRLSEAFAQSLADGLRERKFLAPDSSITPFATPRRLAVTISDVVATAADEEVADKLLPVKVALDAAGQPSQAFVKKMQSLGRAQLATATLDAAAGSDRISVRSDGKADYVYLHRLAQGQSLRDAVEAALQAAIASLPIPKMMGYAGEGGYYNDQKFVRPARKLIVLYGTEVLAVKALGLVAGRVTGGHRFASRGDIEIASAEAYAPTLEAEGKVTPSYPARRDAIAAGLRGAAGSAQVLMPDALLDEVTALVEWPTVYAGSFDAAFLEVPQECLVLTMQQNQKYFALADTGGTLVNRFLLVSNIATPDPAAIVRGNERVLRARLADAKFFFDYDRRQPLAARIEKLAHVVYHNKLGTQGARVERLRRIATAIAPLIGADAALADRAALLAKADLVTDMVGEFPELQGTMGRYYALHDGEPAAVADAIAQHYLPRFAGDALPETPLAQTVALADKLEALAGLFGIGQVPTGDKDPFALRRAALGVVRILVEGSLAVPLSRLTAIAIASMGAAAAPDAAAQVDEFIYERLRGYLREQGYSANEVAAVVDAHPHAIADLAQRLAAVRAFEALPEAGALAAANKRIVNILRKSGGEAAAGVDPGLLTEGAERDLHQAFAALAPRVDADCMRSDFGAALRALAGVKPAVDRFFDDVMVMADDPAVRANRLALLRDVTATMNRVADIGKLA